MKKNKNITEGKFYYGWESTMGCTFTETEFKVFIAVTNLSNKDNGCYAKQITLANNLHLRKEAVNKALKQLCKNRVLEQTEKGFIPTDSYKKSSGKRFKFFLDDFQLGLTFTELKLLATVRGFCYLNGSCKYDVEYLANVINAHTTACYKAMKGLMDKEYITKQNKSFIVDETLMHLK